MERSLERFELSPENYFADVDRNFKSLRTAVATVEQRLDSLAALYEELAATRAIMQADQPLPQRWTWDVRLPNYVFDDIFEAEPVGDAAKRWVGGSGRIEATLRLPRTLQYEMVIQIEDFVSEEAARSFFLRIDGVQYPWLGHADKRYTSLILADPEATTLTFEIGIDRTTITAGRDVSFSFRSIDVAARR